LSFMLRFAPPLALKSTCQRRVTLTAIGGKRVVFSNRPRWFQIPRQSRGLNGFGALGRSHNRPDAAWIYVSLAYLRKSRNLGQGRRRGGALGDWRRKRLPPSFD
jgi:hypothetical protein